MKVKVEINDDYFFELIKRTRAENISEAVEQVIEDFIREGKEIGKKEIDEKLIAEKVAEAVIRKVVFEKLYRYINDEVRKVTTPKITAVKKEIEKLKKEVKVLEESLQELKEEVKGLPTEKNLLKLQREVEVLEKYVDDRIRELTAEVKKKRLETALKGIEEKLPIKLEIAKKKGDAFCIKAESRILKLTPAGLEELLDEEGVKVKVIETEEGFNVVVH